MDFPDKQARFVEEYLIDLNATQAAIRAGYSPDSAHSTGWDILRKPEIQEAIQKAMNKRAERTGITQERVLKELARIAFANMGSFATWGPRGIKLRSKRHLSVDDRAAVAELSETTSQHGGSIKFKLHDKLGALEKLMRHLGMNKEKSGLDELLSCLGAVDPNFTEEVRRHIASAVLAKGSDKSSDRDEE